MRVLLVEDDTDLSFGIKLALSKIGYGVDDVDNGAAADHALAAQSYDMVVLDLGLPRMDGMEVLRRLRRRGLTTPVLILTARDSVEDRVVGLDAGADDYLMKPFAMNELMARMRALSRRGTGGGSAVLTNGALTLDTARHAAYVGETPLKLTGREFALLELLMRQTGKVLPKSELVEHFSDWDNEVGDNAVEVAIFRLRKKLAPHGIAVMTVRGAGYLMERDHSATVD